MLAHVIARKLPEESHSRRTEDELVSTGAMSSRFDLFVNLSRSTTRKQHYKGRWPAINIKLVLKRTNTEESEILLSFSIVSHAIFHVFWPAYLEFSKVVSNTVHRRSISFEFTCCLG